MRSAKNLFLLLSVGLLFVACQKTEHTKKPNIVYILNDQWRASALGYAGDPNVKTPNLARIIHQADFMVHLCAF